MPTSRSAAPLASFLALALGACAPSAPLADAAADASEAATDASAPSDVSAASDAGPALDPRCPACETYGAAEVTGALGEPALTELSGLVASRAHAGVYWAHNDSGDGPRLFALDERGAPRATLRLRGARAVDWEDLAAAPCGEASCLYVADVGDNAMARASVTLYRVREPATLDASSELAVDAEALEVRYPDGPRDCEALLVDPREPSTAYLLEKVAPGPAGVYRVRLPSGASAEPVVAERVSELRLTRGTRLVTAADAHPCAPWVLVRTYDRVYELRAPAGASLLDALRAPLVEAPSASERQGEALAYAHDGRGYLTVSEGAAASVHRVRCAGGP